MCFRLNLWPEQFHHFTSLHLDLFDLTRVDILTRGHPWIQMRECIRWVGRFVLRRAAKKRKEAPASWLLEVESTSNKNVIHEEISEKLQSNILSGNRVDELGLHYISTTSAIFPSTIVVKQLNSNLTRSFRCLAVTTPCQI